MVWKSSKFGQTAPHGAWVHHRLGFKESVGQDDVGSHPPGVYMVEALVNMSAVAAHVPAGGVAADETTVVPIS
jgi:hypothetical protein